MQRVQPKLKLLALDTSTDACSAALLVDDQLTQRFEVVPQKHTELILPMIESLLLAAKLELKDLDAIAFGCGPGSFTGVRLATSVTQGLAFGADLKVVPICSLQAIAQAIYVQHNLTQVLVVQDARMQEVYWGAYQVDAAGLMQPVVAATLSKPQNINLTFTAANWAGVGNGWESYAACLQQNVKVAKIIPECYPQAKYIAQLAVPIYLQNLAISPEEVVPLYLRDEVAWK